MPFVSAHFRSLCSDDGTPSHIGSPRISLLSVVSLNAKLYRMPPIAAAKLYIQDAPKNEARNSWPQFCQILTDLLLLVVNRLFSDIDILQVAWQHMQGMVGFLMNTSLQMYQAIFL